MTTNNGHSGTLRTDYEAGAARLDNFPVVECDRHILLHRLMKQDDSLNFCDGEQHGTLLPLLENQVLTVLSDIARKQLKGYGDTFAEADGTAAQAAYTGKLLTDIQRWIVRLESYIHTCWQNGNSESTAARTAQELEERLKSAIDGEESAIPQQRYYRMLRCLTYIQEHTDHYLEQIETSGDTDPSIALLAASLKNYIGIAGTFNNHIALLPEWYFRDILHTTPQPITQDHTYVVISLSEAADGFTLPQGTAFGAGQTAEGEELIYRTDKDEYISPMQCVEVKSEALYAGDKASHEGWQVESSMLVLNEGERKISLRFQLTDDSISSDFALPDSITLQLSIADGWAEYPCEPQNENDSLCLSLILGRDEVAPAPCTEEIHGMMTEYPAIRILTSRQEWEKVPNFNALEIQTEVNGIQNFTLCNELGEVDTSQPFSPFGIQAECGAWFLFGNGEMGLKSLREVSLKGKWQKLPDTKDAFNRLYAEYGVNAASFTVSTQWQKSGHWDDCENSKKLFSFDGSGHLESADLVFNFGSPVPQLRSIGASHYEYSRDKDGFFRIILQTPAVGFGMEAYRTQFTEVMIHNGRCKEKAWKPLPIEPAVPLLADVELSYIAVDKYMPDNMSESSIRLSRITTLSEQETFPTDGEAEQPFLLPSLTSHLLYFAFTRAQGEKKVRMYIDVTLSPESIPFGIPEPDKNVKMSWELWNGSGWTSILPESVLFEETCGLAQSGFVEIKLLEKITEKQTDGQGRMWLRAALDMDGSTDSTRSLPCLTVQNVWTNCLLLTATNSDGTSLPAGTVQEPPEADDRIAQVEQPLSGFGGQAAETPEQCAVRGQMHIHHRGRAVTLKDYEQIVLEHFPEVDKAVCLSIPHENAPSEVCLVVFSRSEDSRYCLSPAWKLDEIRRTMSGFTSPYVSLKVVNPVYERINIDCRAVLWDKVQDQGKVLRQLETLAQNYIAPWYRKGDIPDLGRHYSYKELHARMANHEALMKLVELKVGGFSMADADIRTTDRTFGGSHPWSVLLPEVNIELLSPGDGIEQAEIGGNFIIG